MYVLVNNAGILRDAQLIKYKDGAVAGVMSDEQFDAVIAVNLKGVFICTRAVAPHMIAAGGGVILNASSVVGLYGNFGQTNYVATKAGVIGMTQGVGARTGQVSDSRERGGAGIHRHRNGAGRCRKRFCRRCVGHTPLGRMGQPEDVANAYAWLASDQASFITGTVLGVDGGAVTGT